MKKSIKILCVSILLLTQAMIYDVYARVLYSFENSKQGWDNPAWSIDRDDHIAKGVGVSEIFATDGTKCLEVNIDFKAQPWMATIVQVEDSLDLTPYHVIQCDVWLPANAPKELEARLILLAGDDYKWIEVRRCAILFPGEMTRIRANLKPDSKDWKMVGPITRVAEDGRFYKEVMREFKFPLTEELKANIQGMALRFESRGIKYKGSICIDNIKVIE